MGIQITFNTEELSAEDVLVLGALARSLGDPQWAEKATEPAPKAPAKRGPGRPRKAPEPTTVAVNSTDTPEKVVEKVAEKIEAAEKPAPEPEEAQEEPAKPAGKVRPIGSAKDPKKAVGVVEEEPEPAAEEEPAPAEEEPAAEESESKDTVKDALTLASAFIKEGRGGEVRDLLRKVEANKVSDLTEKNLPTFMSLLRSL